MWTGKGGEQERKVETRPCELRMLVKGQSQGKREEAGVLGGAGGKLSEKGRNTGGWGQMEPELSMARR